MMRIHTAGLVLTVALGATLAFGQASPGLSTCQKAMAKESATYVRAVGQTVDKCLGKMSAAVVKGGVTTAAAASATARFCAAAFARLADTGGAKELGTRFDTKVGLKCDAAGAAPTLGTANLGEYCKTFGGDGTIDDFAEWRTCIRAGADAEAREAIATRWPRALEYFAALIAAIDAQPAGSRSAAGREALIALDAWIEGPVDDDKPDPAAAETGLLATGATQCQPVSYHSGRAMGPCRLEPKDQDGFAQAGFDARYTDNGDGTITDQVTGLTWEKLGDDGSIHRSDGVYGFAEAINLKIAALNAGGGFAGHIDWRLPNRRELESLVDSSALDPAVRPVFDDACSPGCSALECSCTQPAPYWTSTAYQADPSNAWIVDFYQGRVFAIGFSAQARVRAVRGGVHVAAAGAVTAAADGKAPASLATCQKAVAAESAKYVRVVTDTVGTCLDRMSGEVVGRGATPAAAARGAGSTCVGAFAKLAGTTSPEHALAARFDAKVAAKCDPALDADTWTIGARTLAAGNLSAYCAQRGGDGEISSFPEWQHCVRTAADAQAREAIALRWPRALEYFAALATELAAAPASGTTSDALAALRALDSALEGTTDDDRPEPPPPPPAGLLATGQTQCVQADLSSLGPCPGGLAGQDGAVRAGIAPSYTDNGDGTITDHVTGLMWEKLSDDDSIHDRDHPYFLAGAHFNKVARLNRHGFAGYSDWRVPNRRELESLVDAGRVAPAIDPIFAHGCSPGCSVLECSCMADAGYYSSTYARFPGGQGAQVRVDFHDGAVAFSGDRVRAVRGGNAPVKTFVDQAPEAMDVDTKHPWKQECIPITLFGRDDDSSMLFVELLTPPQNGFLVSDIVPGVSLPLPGNGQIPAAMPDGGHPDVFWGPYDHAQRSIYGTYIEPSGEMLWAHTVCYVTFSWTFLGTDSFTYRVRDNEGTASNVAIGTLTVFED
ncbi:MAG: DUF1566 domain-containing protein [bacterium]|nr:DUF1566 domain-containing protein [bacterium]